MLLEIFGLVVDTEFPSSEDKLEDPEKIRDAQL